MSDPVPKTMLPPGSSELMMALDVLEERLFGLSVDLIRKDPKTLPADMLDLLAWEYSVDVWDRSLPIETRRLIVERSSEVHQYKGTLYGLREALSVFDFDVDIVEWWQEPQEGVPGTFRVTVRVPETSVVGSSAINDQLQLARRVIERNAPVSRGFSLGIGHDAELKVATGAGVFGVMSDLRDVRVTADFDAKQQSRLALFGHFKQSKVTAQKMNATAPTAAVVHVLVRMEE